MDTTGVELNRPSYPEASKNAATGSRVPGSSISLAILYGLLGEVPSIEQFAARQNKEQRTLGTPVDAHSATQLAF